MEPDDKRVTLEEILGEPEQDESVSDFDRYESEWGKLVPFYLELQWRYMSDVRIAAKQTYDLVIKMKEQGLPSYSMEDIGRMISTFVKNRRNLDLDKLSLCTNLIIEELNPQIVGAQDIMLRIKDLCIIYDSHGVVRATKEVIRSFKPSYKVIDE